MYVNEGSLLCLLLLLLINMLQVLGFGEQKNYNNRHLTITRVEVAYTHPAYIGSFANVSPKDVHLYAADIVALITQMHVHVVVTGDMSHRPFFEKSMSCCELLGGVGLGNSIMRRFLNRFILNSTFRCPFKPGRYFLRLEVSPDMLPALRPNGNFKIDISLILPNKTVVLNLKWKYTSK